MRAPGYGLRRRRALSAGVVGSAALAGASLVIALTALPGPVPVAAAGTTKITVKAAKVTGYGEILEDQAGLPLYYDTADKPPSHWACTHSCLTVWPALVLPKGQKKAVAGVGVTGLSTIKGPSGLQVTWRGKPLYTYDADSSGKVTGQGVANVWFVAQLRAPSKSAAEVTTTTGGSGGGWG